MLKPKCGHNLLSAVRVKKSELIVKETKRSIREFCTAGFMDASTPGIFDAALYEHIRKSVFNVTIDGAADEQLAARLLARDADGLPNLLAINRDRAHAVRTTLKSPMSADERMKALRWHLFDKPLALGKLMQWYPRFQKAHLAAQDMVLNADGEQGGGLRSTLQNFSYAKQRFESESRPWRRMCCMVNANMLALTTEVDDKNRKKCERDAAEEIGTVVHGHSEFISCLLDLTFFNPNEFKRRSSSTILAA